MNEGLAEALLSEILGEYKRARKEFSPFNSRHEGYGVILEELDEAWDSIKTNQLNAVLESEMIQIGAMVLAFLLEVIYDSSEETKNETK